MMKDGAPAVIVPPGGREESLAQIEQLRRNDQLPSPKGVALAIMDICRQENVGTDAIARVVQADAALTSRLLRLANAAAASSGRPVAGVPEAVLRLGLRTVRQVAMGFSLIDQYQTGPCEAFDYARFWSHSLLMAVAAQALGTVCRVASPDELFACGLMARIGCLALATVHPAEYAELLKKSAGDADLTALEREHLQADHNDFTAAVLAECGVPAELAEPVFYHEAPETSGFSEGSRPYRLVHLFYHAKRVADMGLAAEGERNGIISELMMLGGKLGLDCVDFGSLVDRIVDEWREWGDLLKVPASALPSFSAMAAAPAPKAEELEALPVRVLLAEDDPTARVLMQALLTKILGHQVYCAGNGREALALALEVMPHIVLTDWLMPVMDGLEFCRALRASEWGKSVYVVMLTGVESEEEIVGAFEAGVDDYIVKPVNLRALRARMRAALHYVQLLDAWERDRARIKQFASELAISNRRLEHFALTDQLTDLPNRRAGLDMLTQAWSAANRSGSDLAVLILDVDHFKSVNDTHGHAVGDHVLREVARLLRASARKDDHVSRIGGEEFLMVCRNTDLKSALLAAERLRQKVRSTRLEVGGTQLQITVSIGVACREADTPNEDALVRSADEALYAAKRSGRDRACVISGGRVVGAVG